MADKVYNKIIYGGNVLLDLTGDTATAADVASGKKFHDNTGAQVTGTNTKDSDTTDATATAAEILNTKTAYVGGNKLTGTMPNRGGVTGNITTKAEQYSIQQGYHDGSGKVGISSTEQTKIIATNIRQGITILGVEGSMSGTEDVNAEAKTVTPTTSSQVITPGAGYNYLSQVTVNAIPYTETANATGTTVTIG